MRSARSPEEPAVAVSSDLELLRSSRPAARQWVAAIGAVALVVAFTVVAWNRFGTDPGLVGSPLIGKPAPTFALPDLDGGTVHSAELAGRVYVVNFWASWCVPCREEAPHLQSFYERWSPQGVEVIGIVYQDSPGKAAEFREEFGLTFPQVLDTDGATAIAFGVFGIPETYVIDHEGTVKAKLLGAVGPATLDDVLAEVLAGGTYLSENDRFRTAPGAG